MNESIKEKLESIFKDTKVSILEDKKFSVSTKKELILPVLNFLKGEGYEHLALISCVDWIDKKRLELVYVLSSYFENEHLILKTTVSRKKPSSKTVIDIFENAEPYEREIHELFGINFEGHPRQIPLFLERDYKIPPFRKDFDTREYVKQVFDEIPFVEEDK